MFRRSVSVSSSICDWLDGTVQSVVASNPCMDEFTEQRVTAALRLLGEDLGLAFVGSGADSAVGSECGPVGDVVAGEAVPLVVSGAAVTGAGAEGDVAS